MVTDFHMVEIAYSSHSINFILHPHSRHNFSTGFVFFNSIWFKWGKFCIVLNWVNIML